MFIELQLDKPLLVKRYPCIGLDSIKIDELLSFDELFINSDANFGLIGKRIVKLVKNNQLTANSLCKFNLKDSKECIPISLTLPNLENAILHPTFVEITSFFPKLIGKLLNNGDLVEVGTHFYIVETRYPGIVDKFTKFKIGGFIPSFLPSKTVKTVNSYLVYGKSGIGKSHTLNNLAKELGYNTYVVPFFSYNSDSLKQMKLRLMDEIEIALKYIPCMVIFDNVELSGNKKIIFTDVLSTFDLFYAVTSVDFIDLKVDEVIKLELPNLAERQAINAAIAPLTNGLTIGELKSLVKYKCDVKEYMKRVTKSHFIPNVSWSDIGGLHDLKETVIEIFKNRSKGSLMLHGPPGTGKTLVAKAIATTMSYNFISVKGPELISMYFGESEENIRNLFQRARECKPSIIFFDEIDSIATIRSNRGVMDRITSQLMVEMDDCSDVYVIGATNRLDLIDPSLLRAGRFDTKLYMGFPTKSEKIEIMKTQFKNVKTDFCFETVIDYDLDLTGADIYSIATDAIQSSLKKQVEQSCANSTVDFTVTQSDFIK